MFKLKRRIEGMPKGAFAVGLAAVQIFGFISIIQFFFCKSLLAHTVSDGQIRYTYGFVS